MRLRPCPLLDGLAAVTEILDRCLFSASCRHFLRIVPRQDSPCAARAVCHSSTRAIASASGPTISTSRAPVVAPDEAPARSGRIGRRFRLALVAVAALAVMGGIYVAKPRHVAAAPRPGGGREDRLRRRRKRDRGSGVEAACVCDGVPADPAVNRPDRGENGLRRKARRHGARHRGHRQRRGPILTALHVVDGATSIRVTFVRRHRVRRRRSNRPTPRTTSRCSAPNGCPR